MLDASLDTSERGLGMNSSVSENPTLARGTGLGARGVKVGSGVFSSALGKGGGTASDGVKSGVSGGIGGISGSEGESPIRRPPKSAGLFGALLPRNAAVGFVGWRIRERSWLDMAADRRCLCRRDAAAGGSPSEGGANPGEAIPLSDFVGLVLMTVMESPVRMLPPTNSLPPLLWPWPPGLEGDGMERGEGV